MFGWWREQGPGLRKRIEPGPVLLALIGFRPEEADFRVRSTRWTREAEWRWHGINVESKRRGCPCGQPATVARRDYTVTGTVPYEVWTCAEHAGAESWQGWEGHPMEPHYGHGEPCPLGEDRGRMSSNATGQVTRWFCPHRYHGEVT